jgi:hypothetical protein
MVKIGTVYGRNKVKMRIAMVMRIQQCSGKIITTETFHVENGINSNT